MSLFAEAKSRNMFRVGVADAVVAWLLIQAANILLGNFGAPEWVFKSLTALLLLGFPVALFMSWAATPVTAGRQHHLCHRVDPGQRFRRPGRRPLLANIRPGSA